MGYGIVSLGCMAFMWYVDRDDDDAELEEELEWRKAEEAEARTWKGQIKQVMENLSSGIFHCWRKELLCRICHY